MADRFSPADPADHVASVRWRPFRRALVTPAVAILATAGYLGCLTGCSSGSGLGKGPAASRPAASAHGSAGSAPASPSSAAAQPATTHPTAGDLQYYAGRQFTMRGGGCRDGGWPSFAILGGDDGPAVFNGSDTAAGDLYISCTGPSRTAGIGFNKNPVAQLTGAPSEAACSQAIRAHPLPSGDIPLSQLPTGTRFCTLDTKDLVIVQLTLQRADPASDDLTWVATAWQESY